MLNGINFPSLNGTRLFLRRAYSFLRSVAEPTAKSACLAPDIGVYFVLEMATISYSLHRFKLSLKLQLCYGLLQTHQKQASNTASKTFSPFNHHRIFRHLLSHFCHV